jgi:hypothetical protein
MASNEKGKGGNVAANILASQQGRLNKQNRSGRPAPEKFNPRAAMELMQRRQAICEAEGLTETKVAFANLTPGEFFICGEYFEVYVRKSPSKDGSGAVHEMLVIEKQENGRDGVWIPGYWLHFSKLNENLFKVPKMAEAQKKIWQTVSEYIGEEILEPLRKASAERGRKVRAEKAAAEAKAEMQEYTETLLANASGDLVNLFHRKIPGGYKLPSFGTVVELRPSQSQPVGTFYVLKSEDPVLRHGMEKGWFVPFGALDWQEVKENAKFSEEQRKPLFDFQSALWAALREARAATHMPMKAAEEPLVVKLEKKVVKPAAPAYPAISGIDPRCQIKGIALCASTGANKLFVVVNGQVTGTLDARFGRPGMNTPRGVFRVYYRNPAAYSYKYGARMPFSLFFIGGYAIHFSDEFAEWGWSSPSGGSHGCVNLRDMTGAKRVFDSSPIGTRVVVY